MSAPPSRASARRRAVGSRRSASTIDRVSASRRRRSSAQSPSQRPSRRASSSRRIASARSRSAAIRSRAGRDGARRGGCDADGGGHVGCAPESGASPPSGSAGGRGRRRRGYRAERVRPQLRVAEPAVLDLVVDDRVEAVVEPEAATLPAGLRVVDATVEPALVGVQRVRDAQGDPLLRLLVEDLQRVGVGPVQDHRVLAQAERVEPVNPEVVVQVGGRPLHPGWTAPSAGPGACRTSSPRCTACRRPRSACTWSGRTGRGGRSRPSRPR